MIRLHRFSIASLIMSQLVTLMVYSILYAEANKRLLLVWCAVTLVVNQIRLLMVWFWNRNLNTSNAKNSARAYALGAFFAGLSWASILFFYSPDLPQLQQLMILIILATVPAASLSTNTHLLSVFLSFSIPIWSSAVLWAVLYGAEHKLEFVVLGLSYAGLIFSVARRDATNLKRLVTEEYENKGLINEVREINERLSLMAYEDPLTRLANRRQFEEKAIEAMGLLEDTSISEIVLIVIDLDNFKNVNDSMGHDAGDELLKTISNRMMMISRHSEVVVQGRMATARIGGDEFAVMYCIDKHNVDFDRQKLAERMLNSLAEAMELDGNIFWPGVSIGIAVAPSDATNFIDLRRCADSAMYQAKRSGGNQFCFYHN